jgi:AraC-like DNA-binding protein
MGSDCLEYVANMRRLKHSEAPTDWRVREAIRIVRNQLCNHAITLRVAARELRTSPRHLERIFRAALGVPFHRFVFNARMEAAGEILKEPQKRLVKEVASLVGYRDTSNFVRDFRCYFGTTPGRYPPE